MTIQEAVNQIAPKYGISPNLMFALGRQESGLNNMAAGDNNRSHGAWQINLDAHPKVTVAQAQNIEWSTNYAANFLSVLYKRYGNNADMLAAYNSGRPLAQAPASTQQYVKNILGGSGDTGDISGMAGSLGGSIGGRKMTVRKPTLKTPTIRKTKLQLPKPTPIKAVPSLAKLMPKPQKLYKVVAPQQSSIYRLTEPDLPRSTQLGKIKMPSPVKYRIPSAGSLKRGIYA